MMKRTNINRGFFPPKETNYIEQIELEYYFFAKQITAPLMANASYRKGREISFLKLQYSKL